jgi:hypothetical protein
VQGLLISKMFLFQLNKMSKEEKGNDRMESYPRPTQTDKQLQNQPEFIDQQPNDFEDKSISDIPDNGARKQSNDPGRETRQDQ